MDGNLVPAPQIIKWNFREGEDSQGRLKLTHECHLIFCVISVSMNNWEVIFCPPEARYRAGGREFRKRDRYHRPNGPEGGEFYRNIDEALASVKRYRTRREVYDHSKAGKFNLDDQPWEWRDEAEILEEALVRERVVKVPKTKTRKKRVMVEEPESIGKNEPVEELKQSLPNEYRPTTFEEVIGQDTAIGALIAGWDAGQKAFILSGPSGVGKTTIARLFARIWLRATDHQIHEHDAARFSGVDAMDKIASMVEHIPLLGGMVCVFIIDECQRLSQQAWTVLLKTVEDSPPGWYWFFVTTELGKVPDTFDSQRCAVIRLQLVGQNDILARLETVAREKNFGTPTEVLALCASEARGAPRRGITLLSICHQCKTRAEAREVLGVADTEEYKSDYGYQIAKLLPLQIASHIQKLVKEAKAAKEHPESIRAVIRSYYETTWLNAKDSRGMRYAARVLSNFEEPVTDYGSLILALDMTMRGGTDVE